MFGIALSDKFDYLKSLPDSSIDLVVTSPPYGIGKEYEGITSLDDWLSDQIEVIDLCSKKLKPTGSLCWQVGNKIISGQVVPLDCWLHVAVCREIIPCDLSLRNRIVWAFDHGLHCKKRFSGRHETVLWYSKSDDYVFNLDAVRVPQKYPNKKAYKGDKKGQVSSNPLGKNPEDVWFIPNVKNNHPEKTAHPCQFPEALVDRLILALTNPGGVVLDPYAGSGTVLASAVRLGRVGIGCDIKQEYVDIALRRLERVTACS